MFRSVFLVSAGIAIGGAGTGAYTGLTAQAATEITREHADRLVLTAEQQAAVEACVAPIALGAANKAMAVDKTEKALALKPGACVLRAANVSWEMDDNGACSAKLEYATYPLRGSWVLE